MANVIVQIKVLPTRVDADFGMLAKECTKLITKFGGKVAKSEIEPIAFGMNALIIFFVMDEKKGSTEPLEIDIGKVSGVSTIDVLDVRRGIG